MGNDVHRESEFWGIPRPSRLRSTERFLDHSGVCRSSTTPSSDQSRRRPDRRAPDNGSYSGIIFPYVWPGENHCREYWLRRDKPEIEYDSSGAPKEKHKYLGPPGRGNLLYVVPGMAPELLTDVGVPIAITEGVKKTIALYRLSAHDIRKGAAPRFLPVGLAGVWSFRGIIGKTEGPDGSRRDEKGPIPDLDRLAWQRRRVFVVYDANVHTNPSVAAARRALTQELTKRGAEVRWVNLPAQEYKK